MQYHTLSVQNNYRDAEIKHTHASCRQTYVFSKMVAIMVQLSLPIVFPSLSRTQTWTCAGEHLAALDLDMFIVVREIYVLEKEFQ